MSIFVEGKVDYVTVYKRLHDDIINTSIAHHVIQELSLGNKILALLDVTHASQLLPNQYEYASIVIKIGEKKKQYIMSILNIDTQLIKVCVSSNQVIKNIDKLRESIILKYEKLLELQFTKQTPNPTPYSLV